MALRNDIDPNGLDEFSVVFTDRSLNHMSAAFQTALRDISSMLKQVYGAKAVAIVPGGGTYGMEAVARQFAQGANCLVIRNGWFSFRWSQIFETGGFAGTETVLKARRTGNDLQSPFAPVPIGEVTARIRAEKPNLVIAPHVETSSGIILPQAYLTELASAAQDVGALTVLDCIASGCDWVDMEATGIDVLISAPQKGWSSTPCAGLVMLSDRALARMEETSSDSFAVDLKKWHQIMQAYEAGGHAYHATMPTDGLRMFHDTMLESREFGFDKLRDAQWELGTKTRRLLASKGIISVAAPGYEAPGVVVSYTADPEIQSGRAFAALGTQIAAGVPLRCDEGDGFSTFRLGLFGLDKLYDVAGTVARLDRVLTQAL